MIGKRIKYFRNLRGMTQRELGRRVGLSPLSADVRIAQYESGSRNPKSEMIAAFANALNVSPAALTVPDVDNVTELMQILFALEDRYKVRPIRIYGQVCLCIDDEGESAITKVLEQWYEQTRRMKYDEITSEEYDRWRYNYH